MSPSFVISAVVVFYLAIIGVVLHWFVVVPLVHWVVSSRQRRSVKASD